MAKKIKKPGWLEEFKAFAIKGNALSMAVGVIIGGGFSTITKSLTDDLIMPIVSMFLGGVNFSQWTITLPQWFGDPKVDEAGNVIANTLNYGNFISAVINFLILALVVFWLVKFLNKLMTLGHKKEEAAPPPPPEPSNEEKLLAEIRDLLKK
ncbi:MAG: large-conductance mechanosensitive channel protein MscL [Faecousia sp.]